jgi:hypothetical protein
MTGPGTGCGFRSPTSRPFETGSSTCPSTGGSGYADSRRSADTIVAGALVVEEVVSRLLQKAELTVCTSGVRDGLLWSEVFRPETRAAAR